MRRVLLPLLPCFALAGIAAAQSVAGDASPMVGGEGAVPARATRLPASAQQGAMVLGVTHPAATVEHAGRSLRVTTYGSFAFGISRDQTGEAIVRIRQPASGWIEHRVAITPRDWPVERIDGVPPATVNPPKAIAERIERGHRGLGRGTPVRAPADGMVSFAEPGLYLTGGTMVLDHGHGISSNFLHLSRIDARVGDVVKQGDVIGAVGATGRATGAHLHWGMNWFDVRIDPLLVLERK